jgi:hypothetical protein
MTPIHDDLLAILDVVVIESPRRYTLLGGPREIPDDGPAGDTAAQGPPPLVSALAIDLYERLYIRPSSPPVAVPDIFARRNLTAALSAANTGRGTWEPGWTVRRIDEDG